MTPIADMVERLIASTQAPRAMSWSRTRRFVLERDLFICTYCLDNATHVDHIIPVACHGPFFDPRNLTAACSACNLSKGSLMPDEWIERDWGGRPMPWLLESLTA